MNVLRNWLGGLLLCLLSLPAAAQGILILGDSISAAFGLEISDGWVSLLERRLDNLVYKAGLGATIWAARQLVVHGHVLVNGQRLDLPSYQVKENDVISMSDKMKKNVHIIEWVDQVGAYPPYLSVDKKNFSATLLRVPEEGEVQAQVEIQLVVEYYNRLT